MSDRGELSPGTSPAPPSSTPSSPAPSSSPSPAPASSPSPPDRRPPPTNPRAERRLDRWQDGRTEDSQWLAAQRERRAASDRPNASPDADRDSGQGEAPGTTPAEQPLGPIERGEDGKFRLGEVTLSETEIRDLLAHKAASDSRRASLPKEEEYKLETSRGFVVPQGVELQLDTNNPAFSQLKKFAAKHGLTQEQVSELVDIHAADRIGQVQGFDQQVRREVEKLGASGTPRINAIQTFIKSIVPEDTLRDLYAGLISEKSVRGWESLMRRFESQGAGSFSHAHREVPESNGSIPNYDKMSFEQRLAAAEAARNRNRR